MIEKLKLFFQKRQYAYRTTFDLKSPYVVTVLQDLGHFCRASESTFHDDQRKHALLEGRREVFLRIANHINLDPEEFWAKYGRNVE
jgi:hypothetical protein